MTEKEEGHAAGDGQADDVKGNFDLRVGNAGDLGPVSYTHLDVYKRQIWGPAAERPVDGSWLPERRRRSERIQKV